MKPLNPKLVKLLKFGITGCSGMVIDFGITYLLKQKAGINKYIANTCGFLAAATSNYIINRLWTYHSRQSVGKEYLLFMLIALAGLAINSGVIYLMNDMAGINFYIAKAIAIAVVFFWNFLLNTQFNFKSSPSHEA